MDCFPAAETHVVYTVRDIGRTLPAEWQQSVKGGSSIGLDEFVTGVIGLFDAPSQQLPAIVGESHVVEKFPLLHNVVSVLARWAQRVEPSRIHLVTLPPAGSDTGLLWKRFCEATAIDPAVAIHPPRRGNESIGALEAEALRRLNILLSEEAGYDFRTSEWVRSRFVLPVVAARSSAGRIVIRPEHYEWARERAGGIVAQLETAPYDVVGDLADLLPPATQPEGVHPADIPEDAIASVGLRWVADVLQRRRD
jgi:hypothetical protein